MAGSCPDPIFPVRRWETARLQKRFPDVVHVLSDHAATRGAVLAALSSSSWIHFSSHSIANPADPSSSHLLLADQPLTVQEIAQQRLDGAELAFLSACEAARPRGVLPDEAIHLGSAFQLAGYRHVIASLWPRGRQDRREDGRAVLPSHRRQRPT